MPDRLNQFQTQWFECKFFSQRGLSNFQTVAPQHITLGVFTAVPVTHWEITLLLWWKWLPCRKKIKAVDRWMVTGWSLIIQEMVLVTLHPLENDIWQPQRLIKITCFVIEAEGLFWDMAIEVVFCTVPGPSELSVFPLKKGQRVRTQVCALSYLVLCSFPSGLEPWQVFPLMLLGA